MPATQAIRAPPREPAAGPHRTRQEGLARVIASVTVAMPYVVEDLTAVTGQRIVEVSLLSAAARHETLDPERERQRFPYWQ